MWQTIPIIVNTIPIFLIIPYTLFYSKGIFQKIGIVFTIIGIVCHIGMCAIDFVLWSFRDDSELQNMIVLHLQKEPSIWLIFFEIVPAFLGFGLTVQSLGHIKSHLYKVITTIIGLLLMGLGIFILNEYRIIFILGYLFFGISLLLITFNKNNKLRQPV
jgi:accessory gene regulator protein AgrB